MNERTVFWVFFAAAILVYSSIAVFYPLVGDEQFHAYAARFTAENLRLPLHLRINQLLWYHYPPGFPLVAAPFVKLFSGVLGVVLSTRIYSILATLATMALVYKFVQKRIPEADKTVLLIFMVASPFIASNAGLATVTPLGLLAGFAAIYFFYELLDSRKTSAAVLLGVSIGGALLTHYYLLVVPLIVCALAFLNRNRVAPRLLAMAVLIGLLLGVPFYAYNYLTYGYINGPSGMEQSFSGGKQIAPFNAGCVYVDTWLSGINAFAHYEESFQRVDSALGLPFTSKWPWTAAITALYALIVFGACVLARKRPDYAVISLLSIPPVVYGDCFIRYTGVLPLFFGIFLAVAVNTLTRHEGWKTALKWGVALVFAALLVQTFVTLYAVRQGKAPVYEFIQSIPQNADASQLCFLSRPDEPVAPLPTVLLNREVPVCSGNYTKHVLVLKDLRTFETDYSKEQVAQLEKYELVAKENAGYNQIELYTRKSQ